MCLATPRHRPRWPTPRHRALHAPLGAAAFGIATLASLRSPQRGVQRKAKAFYRTEFTPPLYLKEADEIRQMHFKVAIASVFVDLRVMAQSSDNAEFDLQLQEYWRNVESLEGLVKDAHYAN